MDKKVAKRTAMQENFIRTRKDIQPPGNGGQERPRYINIFVLPKLTLPDDKLLVVEVYEKGVPVTSRSA